MNPRPSGSTSGSSMGAAGVMSIPPSAAGAPNVGGPTFGGAPSAGPGNAGSPSGGAATSDASTGFGGYAGGWTGPGPTVDAGASGPGMDGGEVGSPRNDVRKYALAQVTTADGHLIGAHWSGTEELVSLIDPETAAAEVVGVLGDLHWWGGAILFDQAANTVYAAGESWAGEQRLYSLPLDTRQTSSVLLDKAYTYGDITETGKLIGAYWTGSEEEVVLVDPTTGVATRAGALGNLLWWQGQTSYDGNTRTLHAIGETEQSGPYSIFSLSFDTGACTNVPLERSYNIASVTHAGRLIGAYWNGSAELAVLIDPASGSASTAGIFGDLLYWQGELVYDPIAHVIHAVGQDPSDVAHIYHVYLGG